VGTGSTRCVWGGSTEARSTSAIGVCTRPYPFTKSSIYQDGEFGVQLRLSHPVDPQGARVGWLYGQDLFLDVDSAYRAAQTMAMNGDGIVVGVQTWSGASTKAGR
jgi:hypothetical protein